MLQFLCQILITEETVTLYVNGVAGLDIQVTETSENTWVSR